MTRVPKRPAVVWKHFRIRPEHHALIKAVAARRGMSMDAFVTDAIRNLYPEECAALERMEISHAPNGD